MSVTALVGAQYGSEGKGAIAAILADEFGVHVRTGAPNAGHTYYIDTPDYVKETVGEIDRSSVPDRMKVVARSIPVGACNKNASLIIGPGGIIDLELLIEEVRELDGLGLDVTHRLTIDPKALVIDKVRHQAYEGGIRGHAHEKIGSTGEGVGIARMAHLARGVLAKDFAWGTINHAGDDPIRLILEEHDISVMPTFRPLNSWHEMGEKILLEGTQGSGLSSVHGEWPYVTSTDTNAGQMLVDAGLSPMALTNVVLVARTFPIRVAGNSGPLRGEIDWDYLGVTPEKTTVTKKERRIGLWNDEIFARALRLNGPRVDVAITFMDYIDPEVAGVTEWSDLTHKARGWIDQLCKRHLCRVAFVGTGPDSVAVNINSKWHYKLRRP